MLNAAKTEKKINIKTGRLAQHYLCAECGKDFPQSGVQVDHLSPVIDPATGFVDWNTYINRMFCDEDNLQVLCKADHAKKSKQELKERSERKKSSKD